MIERLVLLTDSTMVPAKELRRFLPTDKPDGGGVDGVGDIGNRGDAGDMQAIRSAATQNPSAQAIVRDYQPAQSHSAEQLQLALRAHGGNQSRAAQAVGLTVRQFSYRLRKLGL